MIHTYLLYTYHLCISVQKLLCQNHRINTLITQSALQHCTKQLACTYVFENELFSTTAVQQRQHVGAVGCRTFFFSKLIIMFVSDICTANTCNHPGTSYFKPRHWMGMRGQIHSPVVLPPGKSPVITDGDGGGDGGMCTPQYPFWTGKEKRVNLALTGL
jgi:hypothetical protein